LAFNDETTSSTAPSHATLSVATSVTGEASVTLTSSSDVPVSVTASVNGQNVGTIVLNFDEIPLTQLSPLQPVLAKVAPSATSVSVALVPQHIPAPPVRLYQVTVNGGQTWLTFTGHAATFVIRNLSPRHHYTLLVRARNANGTSPLSRPYHVVTLG
jgi:hypothetical protein